MPSRKQRRRRQKEFRHEYEYVVVDDEGREVEVARDERIRERKDSAPAKTRDAGAKTGRRQPLRTVDPPSWNRTIKRGLFFFPIFFLALSVLNSGQPVAGRVAVSAVYTVLFIPFMYLMDRVKYRAYLRRTGTAAGEPARRR